MAGAEFVRERPGVVRGPLPSGHPLSEDEFFVPDFCSPRMVLAVVLVAELLALVLTLARPNGGAFWVDLARLSVFAQWLGLTSAGLLCSGRPRLMHLSVASATVVIIAGLMVNTALVSAFALWLGPDLAGSPADVHGTTAPWSFVGRNVAICIIVAALLLRHFFVAQQWRQHVRAEARLRIDALQARIQPHFLFNSMNTIAELTRADPARAEEAVEDLADLFRATLGDPQRPLTIREELEVARLHQRIEQLRMGGRLRVEWDVDAVPLDVRIPSLTLQPLLENAIYHGVERFPEGGTVTIRGCVAQGRVELSVTNPLPPAHPGTTKSGRGIALDNIRERLWLAYGEAGSLEVKLRPESYCVIMRFPAET